MTPRTDRQDQCLRAIRELTVRGVPPTLEELRIRLGLRAKSSVLRVLEGLRARGLVDWERFRARSLRILPDPSECGPITRDHLAAQDDESLRRIMSWARALLVERGAA